MTFPKCVARDRALLRFCPILILLILIAGGLSSGMSSTYRSAAVVSDLSATAGVGHLHDAAEHGSQTDNAALIAPPGATWRGALTLVAVLPDPAWLSVGNDHGAAADVAPFALPEEITHAVTCRGPPFAAVTYALSPSYISAMWAI